MLIFSVLTCVVSLTLQSQISLNMYNRYQGINLISPVYFIHGGRLHAAPDQKIDVNAVMRNCIEFDSGQDILEGALVYKILRQHVESDKLIQDKSEHIQLLVSWYADHTKMLHVRAVLVEHDRELDEGELRQLHQKCWQSLNVWVNPIRSNWLLDDDDVVLMTAVKVMNSGYRWDVFTSKGVKDNVERPLWIDAESEYR
jgi:hypothetical protein